MTAALTVLLSGFLAAQSYIGVRAGMSLAGYQNDYQYTALPEAEVEYAPGLHFGVFAEFGLGGPFAFVPELNYIEKGPKVFDRSHVDAFMQNKWSYLEVPLAFKARLTTDRGNLFAVAGPTFGYAITGTTKLQRWLDPNNEVPTRINEEKDYEFSTDMAENGWEDKRFDFGFMAGAGVEFNIGPGNFIMEARHGWDFSDNQKFDGDPVNSNEPAQNRYFLFSVGYAYPF